MFPTQRFPQKCLFLELLHEIDGSKNFKSSAGNLTKNHRCSNISLSFLISDEECNKLDSTPKYAQCLKRDYGKYVVHTAAQMGDLELVRHLIKSGEQPNILEYQGNTPLVLAILNNNVDTMKYLMSHIMKKNNAIQKNKTNYLDFILGK